MKGLVAAVSDAVPDRCRSNSFSKASCTLSVGIAKRVIVDLDCHELHIPRGRKRCDYVFVGEKRTKAWVALIELKSRRFHAAEVIAQLQGGAETVEEKKWLPDDSAFQFVPVLAHGRDLRIKQRNELRFHKVRLCGQTRRVALVRCDGRLKDALDAR